MTHERLDMLKINLTIFLKLGSPLERLSFVCQEQMMWFVKPLKLFHVISFYSRDSFFVILFLFSHTAASAAGLGKLFLKKQILSLCCSEQTFKT